MYFALRASESAVLGSAAEVKKERWMEALGGAHVFNMQDGAVLACDCGVINSAR